MLWPEVRIRVPAGIKQNEDRSDVVLRRNTQERINFLGKARRILLPQKVVQEDSHGVHSQAFGPT